MPYNLKQHFRKTKLCPMFLEGHCASGEQCDYAHCVEELRVIPDLRRTKLCPKSIKGYRCSDENCSFAHNPTELRACDNLWAYKTSLCSFHLRSRCLNGSQCRFAHDASELRPHPTEMPKDSSSVYNGVVSDYPNLKGLMLPPLLFSPTTMIPQPGPLNLEYMLPNTTPSSFGTVLSRSSEDNRMKWETSPGGHSGRLTEMASVPVTADVCDVVPVVRGGEGGQCIPEELRCSPLVIKHLGPDEPLPPALMPAEGNTLALFPPPLFDRRASLSSSPIGSDSTIASIWSDQSPESTARSTACHTTGEEGREGGEQQRTKTMDNVYSRQFLLEVFAAMDLGRVTSKPSVESHKPLNADAPEFIPQNNSQQQPTPTSSSLTSDTSVASFPMNYTADSPPPLLSHPPQELRTVVGLPSSGTHAAFRQVPPQPQYCPAVTTTSKAAAEAFGGSSSLKPSQTLGCSSVAATSFPLRPPPPPRPHQRFVRFPDVYGRAAGSQRSDFGRVAAPNSGGGAAGHSYRALRTAIM
eukprot:GHVS01107909.1.p1 GENE.GHVS01107909.1~~GHVS01107909.1.p1  ORF type:complete len:524 (+),score=94.24 GHVS01107909.1:571-2142(+)